MQIAAEQIRSTILSNPTRLNKGQCTTVQNNIEKIIQHLEQEKTNIHKTEAKYNKLLQDMDNQGKMVELIREAHNCKIEKNNFKSNSKHNSRRKRTSTN